MELADVPAILILVGIVAYIVFAGADFGAGLWYLLAGPGPRGRPIRDFTYHAMAPVWEANHVWLILVVVVLFTAFPAAFAAVSIELFVPLVLLLLGIVLRGAAFTFRTYDREDDRVQARWGLVFSMSSVLAPLVRSAVENALSRHDPGPFLDGTGTIDEAGTDRPLGGGA